MSSGELWNKLQENLERARETGKSVSGRGGYGVLMHLGGGQKRFLGLPDATVWPDAETARFGAMDAFDGYGARDKGDEDYEIVYLQRGQRFLTAAELRELAFKKQNYALTVELKRAKGILWRFMVAFEGSAPAWLRLTLQALSGEAAKFLAESAMRMDGAVAETERVGVAGDAEVSK